MPNKSPQELLESAWQKWYKQSIKEGTSLADWPTAEWFYLPKEQKLVIANFGDAKITIHILLETNEVKIFPGVS